MFGLELYRHRNFEASFTVNPPRHAPHTMHASLGDGVPKRGLPPRHPAMHRTRTVDYAIVMSGEIDMELDDGAVVHLKTGDVLVQRGTIHSWQNRGTEPCRIAFILIDAKPVAVGDTVLHAVLP